MEGGAGGEERETSAEGDSVLGREQDKEFENGRIGDLKIEITRS